MHRRRFTGPDPYASKHMRNLGISATRIVMRGGPCTLHSHTCFRRAERQETSRRGGWTVSCRLAKNTVVSIATVRGNEMREERGIVISTASGRSRACSVVAPSKETITENKRRMHACTACVRPRVRAFASVWSYVAATLHTFDNNRPT